MSDPTQTIRDWPPEMEPAPAGTPVRFVALDILKGLIGERETLPSGPNGKPLKNQGPIVEKVARPFLSEHRFREYLAAEKLLWCAFTVSWVFLEALKRRQDPRVKDWMRIASGSCTTLWENACAQGDDDQGWAWLAKGGKPPEPGDIALYGGYKQKDGKTVIDLDHTGMIETVGAKLGVIEGNAGPKADRVWAGTRDLDEPFAFVRVPWVFA